MKRLPHAIFTVGLVMLIGLMTGCARQTVVTRDIPPGAPDAAPISAEPQWFGCESDADCHLVEGLCRSQTAVNRNFTEAFFSYRDKMNPTLECDVEEGHPKPAEVGCLQKRCAVKPEQVTRPGGP